MVATETPKGEETPGHEPSSGESAGPPELTDAEFGRLFARGAIVGIPVLYAILAVLTLIAVPEHPEVLIAILLPALLAGWYFGGFGALAITEFRHGRRKS